MKTRSSIQMVNLLFLIWLVLAGVFLAPAAGAAVDFEVLKSLGKQNGKPTGALVQDAAGNFYGNTQFGGSHGAGTVYKIDASGNYSVLHEFDGDAGGKNPVGRLLLGSDGNLYGTTTEGGTGGGTVFKLSLSGTFSVLHAFDGSGGYNPLSGLIQGSDGNFYGTACSGGSQSYGTVYKLDSSGNVTVLHSFGEEDDGICPATELVQSSDGSLIGVTAGANSYAIAKTAFKIDASGNYSVLHNFLVSNQYNQGNPDDPYPDRLFRGSDGNIYGIGSSNIYGVGFNWVYRLELSGAATVLYQPDIATIPNSALLIQGADGNFYGATYTALDNSGKGIVFKLDSSWNYSVVYEFEAGDAGGISIVGLIQSSSGNLHGTSASGGSGGSGTVFKLDLSGNYSLLHEFEPSEGAGPRAGLIQGSDGNFYGTTGGGGSYGNGTIYKVNASGEVDFLYSFNPVLTGYSGGSYSKLLQGSDGSFYGTLSGGSGKGSVFKLDPSLNFSLLHNFDDDGDSGGKWPYAGLIQGSDGSLYGTTSYGGSNDAGTIFKIDPSGSFSVLHELDPVSEGGSPDNLVLGSDGNIYGTSWNVQNNAWFSVVFKLTPSGGFSIFHEFDQASEGGLPSALIQGNDGNFYGATRFDGSNGLGTVFKIDASGNYSVLHEFEVDGGTSDSYSHETSLIQGSDGSFYGTDYFTDYNNSSISYSRIFKLDASGNYSVLYDFSSGSWGVSNVPLLQVNNGSFYGTTSGGSSATGGVVYRLTETTQASTTTLTSSLNPSVVGQSVTFTATVSGNNPTGTVEFFVGSTSLGSRALNAGVAALSTPRLIAGTHSITAVYSGDANNAPSTSAAVTQVVKAATGTTLTSSKNPSTFRTAVTFTASVKGNAPTGSVTFLDGSVSLGTATLGSDGKAKLTTAALRRGTHKITARYAGDANNAASTSAVLTQTVR